MGTSRTKPSSVRPVVHSTWSPTFHDAEDFAKWVFTLAKHKAVQLELSGCDNEEEVRDALLRQFHRWPDSAIAHATERCRVLSQQAEQRCQEQVQLYIQEIRGKLENGASALFWINLLQPQFYPTTVLANEIRDILVAFLFELKTIDGVYEQLATVSDRIWAVLTLPLKIEPLFQGVLSLASCGHETAAREAMKLLIMYADEHTASQERKRGDLPIGLSVVASIGGLVSVNVVDAIQLPELLRDDLAASLLMMQRDWLAVIKEVLNVLAKALMTRWASCERAPYEQELKDATQSELQGEFARLSHALATNQLYAVRKLDGDSIHADDFNLCSYGLRTHKMRIAFDAFDALGTVMVSPGSK
ncbi:hypothetical protein PHYBOEH_000929 [Phytophthora boehmeriae]|uniref:Uncharacterized protein n=1 Tax=Phytophthora boehmeriae TaxID=109152 RepID=A0A8T1WWY6_9STRA|nr:hypothetical protein PHYBOEH_000929 [Phytophthora boehmeriae]